MSAESTTEHSGIYAYPGVIATVITIVVGVIFIGGLYAGASGGDHGGDHAPTEEAAH